jgi:hypothetical protein
MLIWDIETMKTHMNHMYLDLEKLPIGKLNKDKILKGFNILNEIQRLLLTT